MGLLSGPVQMLFEGVELAAPEAAVGLEPPVQLLQRLRP
jgi:hypothetical protein